jgi:hypothetical protein
MASGDARAERLNVSLTVWFSSRRPGKMLIQRAMSRHEVWVAMFTYRHREFCQPWFLIVTIATQSNLLTRVVALVKAAH